MKKKSIKNNKILIYIELANEKSRIENSTVAIEELETLLVVAEQDKEINEDDNIKLIHHVDTLEQMINIYK